MSSSPHLSREDFTILKDALRYYLDYLIQTGVRRDYPKHYDEVRNTNIHVLDMAQFIDNRPEYKDGIQLKLPSREF